MTAQQPMTYRFFLVIALLIAPLASCADSTTCSPGRVKSCPCWNGATGKQKCRLDGQSWGQCNCPTISSPDATRDIASDTSDSTSDTAPDVTDTSPPDPHPKPDTSSGDTSVDLPPDASPGDSYVQWSVDGKVFYEDSLSAEHVVSKDTVQLFDSRASFQGYITQFSSREPSHFRCGHDPEGNPRIFLNTPDALPIEWRDLGFTPHYPTCSNLGGPDVVKRWSLSIDQLTSDRLLGEVTLVLEGAGPRDGSTLSVTATFDLPVTQK